MHPHPFHHVPPHKSDPRGRFYVTEGSCAKLLPIMQIEELKANFDILQKRFGDPKLSSIYGAGCLQEPDTCFVFMNPTGKNVAADPKWQGLRAPWIGTKNVWKLFAKLNLISQDLFQSIQTMHATEWTPDFAQRVYQSLADRRLYITNLSKSTQTDARALPSRIFREYLPGFHQEISIIKPKRIIAFGNQVSSIILDEDIKVSEVRKKAFPLRINQTSSSVYPTYYPVGQGMRNIDKAVEDIQWIINQK
jgi:uracil-DNA glycosylase